MLQSWAPIQDAISRSEPTTSSPSQLESSEHREHRLRAEYEKALVLNKNGEFNAAKTAFLNLASQITDRPGVMPLAAPSTNAQARPFARPSKRMRTQPKEIPEWERRLRYATYRNLAETCVALNDHKFALLIFSRALDDDSSDFLVWLHAARAAASCGHLHVARCAFESALMMRPRHWLISKPYRTLLSAIGDSDDDVLPLSLSDGAEELAARHAGALSDEYKTQPLSEPELLTLSELSWSCLVDSLRACLNRRMLGRSSLLVAHPVIFSAPDPPSKGRCLDNVSQVSDDVVVVTESRHPTCVRQSENLDVVEIISCNSKSLPPVTQSRPSHPHTPPDNQSVQSIQMVDVSSQSVPEAADNDGPVAHLTSSVADAVKPGEDTNEQAVFVRALKKPEVRRSSRRANSVTTNDLDRHTTWAEKSQSRKEDQQLIQALLAMCTVEDSGSGNKNPQYVRASEGLGTLYDLKRDCSEDAGQSSPSSWKVVIVETEEAITVDKTVKSFPPSNGGPADLLLRTLTELSKVKAVQYFSTLATLWLTLRDRLNLNAPDSSELSAHIVEALLVSGKKAGKQKARRFQEAGRLLSQIRQVDVIDEEHTILCIRISWLWGVLHDCNGEMQLSFEAAERTLAYVRKLGNSFDGVVPSIAGSELSGYSWDVLEKVILQRISKLKGARDLEKAESELSKGAKGDLEAARRTVSILAPSVRITVRELGLDKWCIGDSKVEFCDASELEEFEARLDKEVELEPRLKVLFDACSKAEDEVGELVCYSIQLRMAVHYYAAKVRSENESVLHEKDHDSSAMRIADLLVHIRKYAMLIKKLSSTSNTNLVAYDGKRICGWTMEQAANIAATTIISLSELLVSKIQLAKYAATSTDLNAADKNRRLGFMRCMLAFPRCISLHLRSRLDFKSKDIRDGNESVFNRVMLHAISLCLHALVIRGCCREEGTSGALIRLYAKHLSQRLQKVAGDAYKKNVTEKGIQPASGPTVICTDQNIGDESCHNGRGQGLQDNTIDPNLVMDIDRVDKVDKRDANYEWSDARVLRHELAQCFECLLQIPELETVSGDKNVLDDIPWLEEGCRVSKHIGLSFFANDVPSSIAAIDVDMCRNVYFFYRKRLFEAISLRRRDARRMKRARDVLTRLAGALPENPPSGVAMLSFRCLDTIVSDVVEQNGDIKKQARSLVSQIEIEWRTTIEGRKSDLSTAQVAQNIQTSTMYFEVCSLHAMTILEMYDTEYKKQKNAERRKRPREMADRLHIASSECTLALRSRPWSIGAWILLGRIFLEISDLALDERELCMSSFGSYRSLDISALGDGDSIQSSLDRAEACFEFAELLLKNEWSINASKEEIDIDPREVLGLAYDGNDGELWYGFGDDGDLFSPFGLSNATTSRAVLRGEPHPKFFRAERTDTRRLAAIRLGSCALNLLRLRELRHFYLHWTQCSLTLKPLMHPANQYPTEIVKLSNLVLDQLREGVQLFDNKVEDEFSDAIEKSEETPAGSRSLSDKDLEWREGYCGFERARWFYTLLEAKMLRKCGYSPHVYLPIFHSALEQNRTLREAQKLPRDIEPFYKLHSARMKILRSVEEKPDAASLLTLLERFSYRHQTPIIIDDVADDEDWMTVRSNAVAEDILLAMQACTDNRGETYNVTYSEYFFKSTFVKAVLLADVLKDTRAATTELAKLFRVEAAAKVMEQGPDGIYRGYFYKLWNYRFTDTGPEPALETERKLIRWRSKLLGLYGQLLQQNGDWRLLAGIILRLKKRSSEDLPVDGAILDDLMEAYAVTRQESIISSMQKGILTDAAAFEISYRMTWDIYSETLRLSQGARRVRLAVTHGEVGETGGKRLIESGRPRCLTSMHSVLRVEHVRWKGAISGVSANVADLKLLPTGILMEKVEVDIRTQYVETLEASVGKWPLDEKMMKLLKRRMEELAACSRSSGLNGTAVVSSSNSVAFQLQTLDQPSTGEAISDEPELPR